MNTTDAPSTSDALWPKLREKRYREHFVAAQVKLSIPFQIRALMNQQDLSQAELAERAGLTQGAISRAANPKYGNLSLNTIVRVAAGLDVAFVGRFVPFSELVRWLDNLSEDTICVRPFEADDNENAGTSPHETTVSNLGSTGRQAMLRTVHAGGPVWVKYGRSSEGNVSDVRFASGTREH